MDPYGRIGLVIEKWADENFYDDFLVSIKIGNDIKTELLLLDCSIPGEMFIWQDDWWEGEDNVDLIGFIPLSAVVVIGKPDKSQIDFPFIYQRKRWT